MPKSLFCSEYGSEDVEFDEDLEKGGEQDPALIRLPDIIQAAAHHRRRGGKSAKRAGVYVCVCACMRTRRSDTYHKRLEV
jgi:hypothetical protein